MTLPPLAAIRVFEAAARHLSFTRAAAELGMSQAAVSYQIKLLEERLGPLFLRKARGVEPTAAGQRLAPTVTAAFESLAAAFEETRETLEGVLALTVVQTFASNWLVPRLGAFQAAHPELAVRLDVSERTVDFAREPFDIGIRGGPGRWPGLVSHALFPTDFTAMLSPALAEKFAPLTAPADLLKLPLVEPKDPWWPLWFAAAGVAAPDLGQRPGVELGAQNLAGRAAVAGQGVALLTPHFFRDELARGQLLQPFPLLARQEGHAHYWLVYPEARRRAAKIRVFRDWILAEIAKDEAALGT